MFHLNSWVMPVDFGLTSDDYARHRAGFPDELFSRLGHMGIGVSGQRLIDIGTGTGTLARGFARRGCAVTGIDPAPTMLEEAIRLSAEEGVSIEYRSGRAEDTGVGPMSADVVTAGQCWHWFDRPAAAAECQRILRQGGALVICHFDWIPRSGTVAAATEALILQHNPAWNFAGGTGIYPAWTTDVADAGFRALETFSFDVDVSYSHESWRGRVRASAGVAASLDSNAVAAFDDAHAALLEREFTQDPLAVPHRVWALVARRP
jgi:SAM-dependent methyltransferase